MSEVEKPYKTTILWGQSVEAQVEVTYEFATEAELDAFFKGIDAYDGFADYEVIDEDRNR